jgi:hypothetical protein
MKAQKILALCVVSLGLWACHQPGPAEQLGKRVDAVNDSGARDAQKAGRKIDDAVDDIRDGVDEARKDLAKE